MVLNYYFKFFAGWEHEYEEPLRKREMSQLQQHHPAKNEVHQVRNFLLPGM
jgi:hypothetical protein